jgi:hypothetical protein
MRAFSFRRGAAVLCLVLLLAPVLAWAGYSQAPSPPPVIDPSPDWVAETTRYAYLSPGHLDLAASAGVQAVHTGGIWPYYPLRSDGGGPKPEEDKVLRDLAEACRKHNIRLVLGLPPFPSVENIRAHPDWRIHSDPQGSILQVEPREEDLGTRNPCNLGPWGDYLVRLCVELVRDYGVAGFSFDGNYHPGICYCPYCARAFQEDLGRDLPVVANLDSIPYREYLEWRGERLTQHYARLRQAIRAENPEAVVMTWTVNAGRYGHLLHSPRAMPTRMNLLLDAPMQEWWLDETNFGASIAPSFGVAYLRAVVGDRPAQSEPYMMSRGNPYGTYSFPTHERLTRTLLATTYGCLAPQSFGWPGHEQSTVESLAEIRRREPWLTHTRRVPYAAMLVSEQTRQYYAYQGIAERYLPHLFGAFRAATEEHLPFSLINDWDLNPAELARYRVLILPNSAALSEAQLEAVRGFVRAGGGLVATCDTSLSDQLGRPRPDFGLTDVFGVSFRGRPKAPEVRPELDANFALTVDERYWQERTGVGTLTWGEHPLLEDPRLLALVPSRSVIFRGPQALVSEPREARDVLARLLPEGAETSIPGAIARTFGQGRVVYLPAGIDAALWSYSFPYQRRLFVCAVEWAADAAPPIRVEAPMCVQATFFEQTRFDTTGRSRTIVHLFNGLNTTAHHGLPAAEVPLREEIVPVGGIRVRFAGPAPRKFRVEPGGFIPQTRREGKETVVELPPLEIHAMLVAEP